MDSTHQVTTAIRNVVLPSSDFNLWESWKIQMYSYGISNLIFFFLLQDCWTHVNAKKGFLPKLWALLKEGGKGMAKALHPNLMPLLSKLPPEVTHPSLEFYNSFFTSYIQG